MIRRHILAALAFLLVPFALSGAEAREAKRDYMTTSFSHVSVEGPISVSITTNANPSVVARGDPQMIEQLLVRKSGNRLRLSLRRTSTEINPVSQRGGSLHVDISSWQVERLDISGPADVSIDTLGGQSVELTIAGTGRLSIGKAASDILQIGMVGNGSLSIESGEADLARIDMDGAPSIKADGFQAERLDLSLTGPGSFDMRVRDEAEISSNGTGAIAISGTPTCNVRSSGMGTIRCGR